MYLSKIKAYYVHHLQAVIESARQLHPIKLDSNVLYMIIIITTYTVDIKFNNVYSAANLSPIKAVVSKSIRLDLAVNTLPYNSDTSKM